MVPLFFLILAHVFPHPNWCSLSFLCCGHNLAKWACLAVSCPLRLLVPPARYCDDPLNLGCYKLLLLGAWATHPGISVLSAWFFLVPFPPGGLQTPHAPTRLSRNTTGGRNPWIKPQMLDVCSCCGTLHFSSARVSPSKSARQAARGRRHGMARMLRDAR